VNGGAFDSTVVMGLVGGVIVGGLFTGAALTVMFTAWVTLGFTPSESDAVKVAVPVKLFTRVTV